MDIEQRIQSAVTYLSGFAAMLGSAFISQIPFMTECLQFGIALIGFIMVCIRFNYDRKLRKLKKPLPFDAATE